jgi:hypothetical protein
MKLVKTVNGYRPADEGEGDWFCSQHYRKRNGRFEAVDWEAA